MMANNKGERINNNNTYHVTGGYRKPYIKEVNEHIKTKEQLNDVNEKYKNLNTRFNKLDVDHNKLNTNYENALSRELVLKQQLEVLESNSLKQKLEEAHIENKKLMQHITRMERCFDNYKTDLQTLMS